MDAIRSYDRANVACFPDGTVEMCRHFLADAVKKHLLLPNNVLKHLDIDPLPVCHYPVGQLITSHAIPYHWAFDRCQNDATISLFTFELHVNAASWSGNLNLNYHDAVVSSISSLQCENFSSLSLEVGQNVLLTSM